MIFRSKDVTIYYLLVYVDDIIVTSNSSPHLTHLFAALNKEFAMKDLGPLNYFLGVEVHQIQSGLLLSQSKYILDLLKRANMEGAKPCSTPISSGKSLSRADGSSLQDPTQYRQILGALQYLSFTRPDICYAVNKVCQLMHLPSDAHWMTVKRILRYLKHTIHYGLQLRRQNPFRLSAYSDADWAGCPDDRRSTGGYGIFFGHNLISWTCRKQQTIARSST